MNNRIRDIEIQPHSQIPAEAEIRLLVFPDQVGPGTEVRGRLMGPSCRFASTVEVAYHLRPIPGQPPGRLLVRAVLPEASLWEPECPFLYEGPVELWQDGRRCDQVRVRTGLRSLVVSRAGLRLNGRKLTLRGQALTNCSEETALQLRAAGVNLLVVPLEAGSECVWEMADRLGFLILGRLRCEAEHLQRAIAALSHRPSCLGWLVEAGCPWPDQLPTGAAVGIEVDAEHLTVPAGAAFVAGRPEDLASDRVPTELPALYRAQPDTALPTDRILLGTWVGEG